MQVPSFVRPVMMAALAVPFLAGCSDSTSSDTAVRRPAVPATTTDETTVIPASTNTAVTAAVRSVERPVTYEEAEAAYHEKRYDQAVDLFTAYVSHRPENPWGHYMRGLAAHKAGQFDVAESALVRTLEIDPAHTKSLVNLARVLLDLERSRDALDIAKQAIELDPTAGDAYRVVGRAHAQAGDLSAAIDGYREAILIDSTDAWAMNNMGLILIQSARFEEALPPLARAVELRPGVALFSNNLGIALERSGYPQAAVEAYGAALAIDSSYAKAQVNYARVSERPHAGEEDVDLGFLARLFVTEMAGWSGPSDRMPVEGSVPPPGNQPKSQETGDGGDGDGL